MATMTLSIRCFGVFRQFGETLSLEVPQDTTIHDIKNRLTELLEGAHKELIKDSVLANDTDILPDTYVVHGKTKLSILPPVCGG
tara:strand:+ start:411 stop:662 length:252 start_codon:yes stop_codon:yes gene_type:complete